MEKINTFLARLTTFCLSASVAISIFIVYAELTDSKAVANTTDSSIISKEKTVEDSSKGAAASKPAQPTQPMKSGFSIKVEAQKADEQTFAEKINTVGTLLSKESVEIKSEIAGRIIDIPFTNGSCIKAGQPLFILENSIQKAELEKASAKVELWRSNYNRYLKLSASGSISKTQLQDADANLKVAIAELQHAKAVLDKTVIKAPFNGHVGIRKVSIGTYVNQGDALVNFDQNELLKIQFVVPEKFSSKIRFGSEIFFETSKFPNVKFKAIVNSVDSRVDTKTRGIFVEVLFDNKERQLLSGQFANISIDISEAKKAVSIPAQSVIPVGGKYYIFKVIDGIAKKYEVSVGRRDAVNVEIVEGASSNDLIVTAGHQKLMDGTPVRVSQPSIVETSYMAEEKPVDR